MSANNFFEAMIYDSPIKISETESRTHNQVNIDGSCFRLKIQNAQQFDLRNMV